MKSSIEKLTIKRGQVTVDVRENWPLRRTPQNVAAVAYMYRVYPLYSDHSINLNDQPFSKNECPNKTLSDVVRYADEPYNTQERIIPDENWYIEKNQFGNYLVFDGDDELLENILDILDTSNIPINRYGRSIRAADNGRKYDWFIRLNLPISKEECAERLQNAFNNAFKEEEEEEYYDDKREKENIIHLLYDLNIKTQKNKIENLELNVSKLENIISSLKEKIKIKENQNIQLLNENTKITREQRGNILKIKDLLVKSEEYKQELYKRVENYTDTTKYNTLLNKKSRIKEENIKLEIQVAQLKESEKALEHKIKCLLHEKSENDEKNITEIEILKCEIERKDENIDLLEEKLKSIPKSENLSSRKNKNYIENFLKLTLDSSFPNLLFHENSYEIIINRFKKPDALIKALSDLNSNTYRDEKCRGTRKSNVYEYRGNNKGHINTGLDDRGRIYLRKDGQKGNLWILVSWKEDEKAQSKTIDSFSEIDLKRTPIG